MPGAREVTCTIVLRAVETQWSFVFPPGFHLGLHFKRNILKPILGVCPGGEEMRNMSRDEQLQEVREE